LITRQHLFLFVVVIFVITLASVATYYLLRARRTSGSTWAALLGRLNHLNSENLAIVALDLVDEEGRPRDSGQPELEPERIWELLGGMKGLESLESNCDVLIDLASYVQFWYPEALLVTEQLRLNAREIKWHIERLKGAAQTGNLRSSYPAYAQRAAATYYLMTRSLLSLYETAKLPGLTELQGSL
jgi:hypothetical protein